MAHLKRTRGYAGAAATATTSLATSGDCGKACYARILPSVVFPRPTITSVANSGNEIRIRGAIDFGFASSVPQIIVQFYANDTCDGSGEAVANGQRFLGAIEATGNERGVFVFESSFPGSLPPSGGVTATATSALYRTTSTLSPCVSDTGGCVRPFIVERPVAVDVTAGASAAFSVGVDSSEPISYQWYEVRSGRTFLIEGATASTFETPPLSSMASYRVDVSNACGSTSADTSATVCSSPPVITAEPDSRFPGTDEVVGVSVELAEQANYTYQWYRGRTGDTSDPIPGGASRVFFVGVAAKTSFWVRVANACGSADSDTATLTRGPFIDKVKYSDVHEVREARTTSAALTALITLSPR